MRKLSKIPREEYKYEHKKLWIWLSEHPDKSKRDYFQQEFSDITQMRNNNIFWDCHCFACVYCDSECSQCPIAWAGEWCMLGEFGDYKDSKVYSDNKSISQNAKIIANLPWRD